MRTLAAFVFLAFVFTSFPAQAQGPPFGSVAGGPLDDLEARVAKLESGEVDATDLVGTYAIHSLGVEMGSDPAQILTETSVGTATLNEDGTGLFVGGDGRAGLMQDMPSSWTLSDESDPPGEESFTWEVVNGTVVIPGDEDLILTIGARGHVLITGGTFVQNGVGSFSNVFMLIRLPD